MLLAIDSAVDELQERVDVQREAERVCEGDAVRDDVDVSDDRRELDVIAKRAFALQRSHHLVAAAVRFRSTFLQIAHQLRVRSQAPRQLEVDAEPVRVLLSEVAKESVESLL